MPCVCRATRGKSTWRGPKRRRGDGFVGAATRLSLVASLQLPLAMLRLLSALTAATLVVAKTGTTPEPMYEIDAVCSDWWHARGCFDPANPDADRGWPSDDMEAIFTQALEGREPGACASCGFGSTAADLPGSVDTSTDCVQCEPPYQLIRLYEDCSGICVDAKTKENLQTAGVQFPFNPWDDKGGVCKPWPWPQCLDGTLRPTPRPTAKPTQDECDNQYHVSGCFDPAEDVTIFPASYAQLMLAALEGRDVGQCVGCGYGPVEDVGSCSQCVGCEEGFELVRIWENCRGFCVDPLTRANLENFWPEPPYNPWDDPAGACTPDPCAPAAPEPATEAPTLAPTDSLPAPTATPTAAASFDPVACATIRCREPPYEPGSLCEFCFGGDAPTPKPTSPEPTSTIVPWIIPVADQAITVDPSTKITFEWKNGHNVWEMPSAAAYASCDFSAATEVCPAAVGGSCTIDAPPADTTKYYACRVGLHCRRGQVVAITSAGSPGTDHTFDSMPPPTPKPTTTLAKGGKADGDEDESDGDAGRVLSVLTAAVAALFTV